MIKIQHQSGEEPTSPQPLDYFKSIQSLGNALGSAWTLDAVADSIINYVLPMAGADIGKVVLLSEDGTRLETLRHMGTTEEQKADWKPFPPPTPTALSVAMQERRSIVFQNREEFLASFPEFASWVGSVEGAVVAIPMLREKQAIGAIGIRYHEPRSFSVWDVTFLETVATQCAQAIQRARLYEEHQRSLKATAQQSANQLLRGVMDCVTESVAILDTDLCFLGFNQTFEDWFLTPFGTQVTLGTSLPDILAHLPEEQALVCGFWRRALAGESFTIVREFGAGQTLETSYSCLRDSSGTIIGAVHVSRDITARTQEEKAIKKSAAMLAEAQSIAQVGSWEFDLVTGQGIWSAEMFRLLEFDPADGIPSYERLLAHFHPEDQPLYRAMEKQAREGGEPRDFDIRVCFPDGRQKWVHALGRSVKNEEGTIVRTLGTVMDVTARKLSEQEQARLTAILERTSDFVVTATPDGRLLYCNQACRDFLGITEAEVRTRTVLDIHAPTYWAKVQQEIVPATVRDGEWCGESLIVSGEGKIIPVSLKLFVHKDDRGVPLYRSAIARDISEQIRTQQALQVSERRYHFLMSAMKDVVSLFDMEARCLYISPSVYEQTGYSPEECLRMNGFDWIYPEDQDHCMKEAYQLNLQGKDSYVTWRLICKDGAVILVETNTTVCKDPDGQPEYMLCVTRNISDRKRLEDQFHQAQKMEGIGQLAGGIAHDFNNLLSVIIGYAELIEDELPLNSSSREKIGNITVAASRASSLTNQLLTFARRQPAEPQSIFLNDLIQEMRSMLKPLIREDIDLQTHLASQTKQVRIDPHQLEQVIINLVVNARDAMPQGGLLTIKTAEVTLEQTQTHARFVVPAGCYVVLSVSDTGTGMTEEVKARLFEPFFTTKGVGKGTGLGLATVYGIVKQSDGSIFVESEVGKGATFTIYLPCLEREVMTPPEAKQLPPVGQGEATVLIVEDEPVLRDLAVLMLQKNGYRALYAADGIEALRIAEAYPNTIHLLLTDAIMPNMGGRQLAERLRKQRPDIAVLLASGYTNDPDTDIDIAFPDAFFLPKPFTPRELLAKIQDILKPRS